LKRPVTLRGIVYGTDTGSATAGGGTSTITSSSTSNVELTGSDSSQLTATAVNTLNMQGNSLSLAGTFTTNGILVAGGTPTISSGTSLSSTTSSGELVIRVNGSSDTLGISTPIINNGTTSLTKSGLGVLTLSGADAYTGVTTVDAGTLALSGTAVDGLLYVNGGTVNVTGNATTTDGANNNSNIFVANAAYSSATLSVSSGSTFADTPGNSAFFRIGQGASSVGVFSNAGTATMGTTGSLGGNLGGSTSASGAIYNTGNFTMASTGNGLYMGNSAGTYGYLYNTGTFTANNVLGTARNDTSGGAASSGVIDVAGGSVNVTNGANLSINDDATSYSTLEASQVDVTGGTLTAGSTTAGTVLVNNQTGTNGAYASINVSSGTFTTPGTGGIELNVGNVASNVATLSLANSGALNTSSISTGTGTLSTNILNLNGGTLAATATGTTLVTSGVTTYIYNGGTNTINNGGFATTIAAALRAPTGSGVTSIALGGKDTGYIGAPVVVISGGGGTGAAAIANFNPTTGTITGFTITSPGSGYTSTPTITLIGGSGTLGVGATAGSATASASIGAVTGGGITFKGVGTTTLSGANTYSGGTTISAGTLRVNNSSGSSGTGTGTVNVQSGATLGGSGYIGTSGTSNGAITVNSGGFIAAGPTSTSATGTGLLTSYSTAGVALAAGSGYTWKINADTSTGTAGGATGWDEIATQSIALGSSGTPLNSGSRFTVNITGSPSAGFGYGTQNFPIATAVNGISLNGNPVGNNTNLSTADPSDFVLSTSGFTAPGSASGLTTSWQLEVVADASGGSAQDLDLVYNATPEPGTAILALAGGLPILMRRRRRKPVAKAD
jgi:hypothetical protein